MHRLNLGSPWCSKRALRHGADRENARVVLPHARRQERPKRLAGWQRDRLGTNPARATLFLFLFYSLLCSASSSLSHVSYHSATPFTSSTNIASLHIT